MLLSIRRLLNAPVMSLQTGQPLCKLASPIVNPYNLRIVAFYVAGPRLDFTPAVVFAEDIREFGQLGAIVDSVDNIMSPDGMVRLNEIIRCRFDLDNILVFDEDGHKLGRVNDYIVDMLNYEIQQLHIKPRFTQSFTVSSLIINRNQIIKIEPDRITVKSTTQKKKSPAPLAEARKALNPNFENPFRKQKPVTNSAEQQ